MKKSICLILFLSFLFNNSFSQDLPDDINISNSPNGIVALPSTVNQAWTNAGFVKYTKITAPNGKAIHFVAQNQLTEAQIIRARNILKFYLSPVIGSQYGADKSAIINSMANNNAILMLLNGRDEGNSPELPGQPLYYEELAIEGHSWYMNNDFENHRDAAFEEILHMMHDYGIGIDGTNGTPGVLPEFQTLIRAAQVNAIANNFQIWPVTANTEPETLQWFNELKAENSLTQEYLASVIDCYYGLWGAWSGQGTMYNMYTPKIRSEIETKDPMAWAFLPKYFSQYINIEMQLDPSLNSVFVMSFDNNLSYTHKSQYLQHCTLTGTNNSGLIGNDKYNRLLGNDANNSFIGNKDNDLIDGKAGIDTAIFTGNYSEYTISQKNNYKLVKDNTPDRDGIDTLKNVEFIKFKDKTITSTLSTKNVKSHKKAKITYSKNKIGILFSEINSENFIQIFSTSGKLVYSKNITSGTYKIEIPTSSFAKGLYIIRIKTNLRESSYKVIVQ